MSRLKDRIMTGDIIVFKCNIDDSIQRGEFIGVWMFGDKNEHIHLTVNIDREIWGQYVKVYNVPPECVIEFIPKESVSSAQEAC